MWRSTCKGSRCDKFETCCVCEGPRCCNFQKVCACKSKCCNLQCVQASSVVNSRHAGAQNARMRQLNMLQLQFPGVLCMPGPRAYSGTGRISALYKYALTELIFLCIYTVHSFGQMLHPIGVLVLNRAKGRVLLAKSKSQLLPFPHSLHRKRQNCGRGNIVKWTYEIKMSNYPRHLFDQRINRSRIEENIGLRQPKRGMAKGKIHEDMSSCQLTI